MNPMPFDVNDNNLRGSFLADSLIRSIEEADEHALPRWGNMTVQNMVEHLMWTFQCSTGKIVLPCHTPEHLLERSRRFLYDDRQTPVNFKNPVLGEVPLPCQFASFEEAKTATRSEVESFLDHYRLDPTAIHIHPIFGPLDGEQWHRAHFKHCYHHLLQFSLIGEPTTR